jgi:hypothetical protein
MIRSSSFWVPRNLSHHMIRQARTCNTVESREFIGRAQTLPWWLGRGRRGIDDRKQNTVAPLIEVLVSFLKYISGCPFKRISLIMDRTIWDISPAEVWKNSILTCSPTASRFYSDTGRSSMCTTK